MFGTIATLSMYLSIGTDTAALVASTAAAPPDPGIDWSAEVRAAKAKPKPGPRPAATTRAAKRSRKAPPTVASPAPPVSEAPPAPAGSEVPAVAAAPAVASAAAADTPVAAGDGPVADAPAASVVAPDSPGLRPTAEVGPVLTPTAGVGPVLTPTAGVGPGITHTAAVGPGVAPELRTRADARMLRLAETRARAQVATGALLAAGGLAGLAVMANGLYVHGISERELARGGGYPAELLAPLEQQHDRSETRIAAGAVAGVVGLALGAALIVPGVRILRAGRPAHAGLRLAPTVGGVLVSGRF